MIIFEFYKCTRHFVFCWSLPACSVSWKYKYNTISLTRMYATFEYELKTLYNANNSVTPFAFILFKNFWKFSICYCSIQFQPQWIMFTFLKEDSIFGSPSCFILKKSRLIFDNSTLKKWSKILFLAGRNLMILASMKR